MPALTTRPDAPVTLILKYSIIPNKMKDNKTLPSVCKIIYIHERISQVDAVLHITHTESELITLHKITLIYMENMYK